MSKSRLLIIIPARWASSRFPGKPLLSLAGRPMLQHVFERVRQGAPEARVIVATDDERIAVVARGFGAEVRMTRQDHPSGTDRCAEVLEHFSLEHGSDPELVVNVQGDEPLLPPGNVRMLVQLMQSHPQVGMGTLACECGQGELSDPAVVKVVTRKDGRALYFSRAGIPFFRDGPGEVRLLARKHIGIYAYRPEVLRNLVRWPQSALEQAEKLEQLRALEYGVEILVGVGDSSLCVDLPEQVAAVEAALEYEARKSTWAEERD